MNKISLWLISCLCIMFSCVHRNDISSIIESNNNQDTTQIKENSQPIEYVFLEKIKKKEPFLEQDYLELNNFLFINKDEAMSEEAGCQLFEFFKNNSKANSDYLHFLNSKMNENKEDILSRLVQIMCIELEYNDYTYQELTTHFKIFEGSESAKSTFYQCMAN